METRERPKRLQAFLEAKQAVRAYAREPSRTKADAVELAWRKVRQLDCLAQWRHAGSVGKPCRRAGRAGASVISRMTDSLS
jgi:hypothetical protein